MNWKYVAVAAVLAALLGYQVFTMVSGDEEPSVAPPAPSARPTATLAPAPSPGPSDGPSTVPTYAPTPIEVDPDLDGDGEVTKAEVARAYNTEHGTDFDPGEIPEATNDVRFDMGLLERTAVAMSVQSFRDSNPNTWTDRLAELSTSEYGEAMRTRYPLTAVVVSDWQSNVVEPRATTRVRGVKTNVVGGSEGTGWLRFRVAYTVQAKYARPGRAPVPAKKGQWVRIAKVAYEFEYTVVDGEWKLNTVDATAPSKDQVSYGDQDH